MFLILLAFGQAASCEINTIKIKSKRIEEIKIIKRVYPYNADGEIR